MIFQETKLIAHEHGGAWGSRGLHILLSRIWASIASIIICNSSAAETIIRKKIYDKDKFKVIYNGNQNIRLDFPLKHPNKFSISKDCDQELQKLFFSGYSIFSLKGLINKLKKFYFKLEKLFFNK